MHVRVTPSCCVPGSAASASAVPRPTHSRLWLQRGTQTGSIHRGRCLICCRDVRGAVDLCHRDGSIKREVAANPER